MKMLAASVAVGLTAIVSSAALAADPVTFDYPVYKDYIPPYIPPVDEGLKGHFYLRGSVAGNLGWAHRVNHPSLTPDVYSVNKFGYGYSAGLGLGWESGDGWRVDVTGDYLANNGMSITIPAQPGVAAGDYSLNLRSKIVLANAYYDFGLGGQGLTAAGGMFGYVGAGAGIAFNEMSTDEPGGLNNVFPGSNTSFAAAGMAGVGYDFGAVVADLGYRGLYINKIENTSAPAPYSLDHALIHELRATLRYRF